MSAMAAITVKFNPKALLAFGKSVLPVYGPCTEDKLSFPENCRETAKNQGKIGETREPELSSGSSHNLLIRLGKTGAACVTRTRDPRITNAMLYQLS
jgi:hypothetical protein